MKSLNWVTTATFTLCFLSQFLIGQPVRFEHFSRKQGLTSEIMCTYQDREGFLWIGTVAGLNKFDGYTFTTYKPDPKDPHRLVHQVGLIAGKRGVRYRLRSANKHRKFSQ